MHRLVKRAVVGPVGAAVVCSGTVGGVELGAGVMGGAPPGLPPPLVHWLTFPPTLVEFPPTLI
jgi:hypothetical protein